MNRVTRFRAWDSRYGKMIPDVTVYADADSLGITLEEAEKYYTEEQLEGTDGHLYGGDDWIFIMNRFELMQFTGLLDKDQKEIYDGDIILWGWGDDRDTGVISWSKTHSGWEISIPAAMWKSPGSLRDFWSDRIEVIGNIHETPELLKP